MAYKSTRSQGDSLTLYGNRLTKAFNACGNSVKRGKTRLRAKNQAGLTGGHACPPERFWQIVATHHSRRQPAKQSLATRSRREWREAQSGHGNESVAALGLVFRYACRGVKKQNSE
jgi:hypothetical protein